MSLYGFKVLPFLCNVQQGYVDFKYCLQVTKSVVTTVNNIIADPKETPQENQNQTSNSSSQIIRSLEKQIALTVTEIGPIKVASETSIAVEAVTFNETLSGLRVGFMVTNDNVLERDIGNIATFVNESDTPNRKIQSSISLPASLTGSDPDSPGTYVF